MKMTRDKVQEMLRDVVGLLEDRKKEFGDIDSVRDEEPLQDAHVAASHAYGLLGDILPQPEHDLVTKIMSFAQQAGEIK